MAKTTIAIAEARIKQSSYVAIQKTFDSLSRYFKRNRWVGDNNRYLTETIDKIKSHDNTQSQHNKHAKEYIAASAVLHCADGWAFLGRVADCIVKGDSDTARHLAYYSELRAAMSLLAIAGIGVFDRKHLVVNPSSILEIKNLSTHFFAWHALQYWADKLPHSSSLLMEVISPGGIPLKTWLDNFTSATRGPKPKTSFVGSDWLKAWGLDLQRLSKDDHDARNEASYRPNQLNHRNALDVKSSSDFLCNLWSSFEPSDRSTFERIDSYLLKMSLKEVFTGIGIRRKKDEFKKRINNMTELLFTGDDDFVKKRWNRFLVDKSDDENPVIINEAFKEDGICHPKHHLQVTSRAALLLRIATGACANLIRKGGFTRSDLEFWWESLGKSRGMWDDSPECFSDLWVDIEAAIEDTCEWYKINDRSKWSYFNIRKERSGALSILVNCELIALWGLGL